VKLSPESLATLVVDAIKLAITSPKVDGRFAQLEKRLAELESQLAVLQAQQPVTAPTPTRRDDHDLGVM
jgi:hypothetical protein